MKEKFLKQLDRMKQNLSHLSEQEIDIKDLSQRVDNLMDQLNQIEEPIGEEPISQARQAVITSLEKLFNRLGNNSEGVSQDDINSLINVLNDGNIQLINLQINEMNSKLVPEDDIAQDHPLNLDVLRQAIEDFKMIYTNILIK